MSTHHQIGREGLCWRSCARSNCSQSVGACEKEGVHADVCASVCILWFFWSLVSICFCDLTIFFSSPPPFLSIPLLSVSPPPPSWLLLWGFSGCIFPVFLSPIQCNFLFINIWFPLSELSSALRPTRSRGLVKKEKKEKKNTCKKPVYLTSPSPLFRSYSALFLLSSLLLTLSISRAPAKCGLCLLPDIRPSACITFPLWQPTANWPTPLLVTVAYVSRAFQSSTARI